MKWGTVFVFVASAAALTAQVDVLTILDYPGATHTQANGINDAGDIVGQYRDANANNLNHGFLLRQGKFTSIDFPGASETFAQKINSRGDIVGHYNDGTRNYGFLLSQGKFTSFDCPGAKNLLAIGINSAGDISGGVLNQSGRWQGLLLKGGACTLIDYQPESPSTRTTGLQGINDAGIMVGVWETTRGTRHGILYSKGIFTQLDHGGSGYLWPNAINNAGDIVGQALPLSGAYSGFLSRNGRYTVFKLPDAISTYFTAINSSGLISGSYTDSTSARKQHSFVARVTPSAPPSVFMVDDDGGDSPGALRTIQEAVKQAVPGSTILVYPGTYRQTVNIVGPEKEGLRLIAVGSQNEVVLQGDYTERDGFHLEDVTNVLIRGFTVRDFGNKLTTANEWGAGNQIYLENAHYNTIEQNSLLSGDMMGVMLVDSGNNTIQNNFTRQDNSAVATSGITLQGAKSTGNTIRSNFLFNNKMAGIIVRGAGPSNQITNNTVLSNGRYGIDVEDTSDIRIEGNRVSYGRGFWGSAMPGGNLAGLGINLVNVSKATVSDNRMRNNGGGDLKWDGKGDNRFDANACDTSTPAGGCQK